MKKQFVDPELEVVMMAEDNVIVTSVTASVPDTESGGGGSDEDF